MGYDQYGRLGDVRIREGGSSDRTEVPSFWEEITPMGRNFAFDLEENESNILSSTQLIHILIRTVVREDSEISLLGFEGDLEWFNSEWELNIILPGDIDQNLPCDHAWVFKFEEDCTMKQKGIQIQ
jgi:hypothetical protein